jgi:hypothetical protein
MQMTFRRWTGIAAAGFALLAAGAQAQTPLMMHPGYERAIAVVPLAGAGTPADPKRPQFMAAKGLPAGVLSWRYLPSDDKHFAIVELVLSDAAGLDAIRAAQGPNVRLFERDKTTRAQLEAELRKYKKDFKLEDFAPVAGRRK